MMKSLLLKEELSKLGSKERAEHLKQFESKVAKTQKKDNKKKRSSDGNDITSMIKKRSKLVDIFFILIHDFGLRDHH